MKEGGSDEEMHQQPLGDRELASDCLFMEKAIAERYHWSSIEASDPELRRTLEQIHDEVHQGAKRLFDYLHRKGWYQPRYADPSTWEWFRGTIRGFQQEVGTAMHGLPSPGQPWGYVPQPASPAWYGAVERRY